MECDGVKRDRCIHLHGLLVRNVHSPLLGFEVEIISHGVGEKEKVVCKPWYHLTVTLARKIHRVLYRLQVIEYSL